MFSVKDNGKAYDITMDEGLTAAMKAFEPDRFASYGTAKAMKKMNDIFKAMNTAWSPWFLIKNAVRDFQDAGFYSTDMKTWVKMFHHAKNQIRHNGEIWQQYQALGGSYSSMLDYTTGMVKEPKNMCYELDAAEHYAKHALRNKDEDKELGDVYERVARQELDHCEMFHAQAVRIIREHGEAPNEAMRAVWEYEHDKIMERDAEIRVKLGLYDGR